MSLKIMAVIAALVAAFLFGGLVEHWRMNDKLSAYKLRVSNLEKQAEVRARKTEQNRQKVSDKIAKVISSELVDAKNNERTITKEVIRYVQNPNTGKCVLNDDWVRAHNNAATMSVDTGTASGVDDKARTITDRDALEVVTKNYATCNERLIRLEGWQKWYLEVSHAN